MLQKVSNNFRFRLEKRIEAWLQLDSALGTSTRTLSNSAPERSPGGRVGRKSSPHPRTQPILIVCCLFIE
jgi:hypothetical protein